MKFRISLAIAATSDLREIFRYIELNDSPKQADKLVTGIEQAITSLTDMPQRDHYPPELERVGVLGFRGIHFKPYRIIYSIHGQDVIVRSILDGRRDMQTLLQQRLLR